MAIVTRQCVNLVTKVQIDPRQSQKIKELKSPEGFLINFAPTNRSIQELIGLTSSSLHKNNQS